MPPRSSTVVVATLGIQHAASGSTSNDPRVEFVIRINRRGGGSLAPRQFLSYSSSYPKLYASTYFLNHYSIRGPTPPPPHSSSLALSVVGNASAKEEK